MNHLNKRLLLSFALIILGRTVAFAADAPNQNVIMYGFVRSDFYYDQRDMKTTSQELFSLYPSPKVLNDHGEDLNAVPTSGMASIVTRMGLRMNGKGFLGADKSLSIIEVDFGGAPNYWLIRLRQAYSQLQFNSSELLIGQTWHPLSTANMLPLVLSLNTGAPFQPFNRSPQVRWDKHVGPLTVSLAGIWQMMYTSPGPDGSSFRYQRDAVMPEWYVGADWRVKGFLAGVGYDVKRIKPQRYHLDDAGIKRPSKAVLTSSSVMAFAQYVRPDWAVRLKSIKGGNLSEHTLIGGYAITPDNQLVNYNTLSNFFNLTVGNTHQLGFLIGNSINLGPTSDLVAGSRFYGTGVDAANTPNEQLIKTLNRRAYTYLYNHGAWRVGVELEKTMAHYATRQDNGHLGATTSVSNRRINAQLMYRF